MHLVFDALLVLQQVLQLIFSLHVLPLLRLEVWFKLLCGRASHIFLLKEVSQIVHQLPLQLGLFMLACPLWIQI